MITTMSKRVLAAAYRQIPERTRLNFERLISPIVFPLVTKSIRQLGKTRQSSPRKPVSIVIPSYGDIQFLKPLLKSIFKTCKDFEYEVIISDDFCEEINSQKLKTLVSDNVQILFHTQRTGFAGAVNRGLAVAKWDVVVLNSDMLALPGWLENLQFAAYEIDPKIGLVSPQLLYPSGRIQYGGTFQVSVSAPQWFGHLDQGRFANFPSANEGKYIRAISGAAVYIKRSVFETIGYLDDQYWLGFEDVDYGFKARQMGYRCYLEPNSKLIHLESATRGKVQGPREYASMRRFWAKWSKAVEPENNGIVIHLLVSQGADPVLRLFSTTLFSFLISSGIKCQLHLVQNDFRLDENVIHLIQNEKHAAYVVALDTESIETAWLATEQYGNPYFYVLGPDEANLNFNLAMHRSLLKPELTYIPTNRWISKQLQSVMPWDVAAPIAPLPATFEARKLNILLINPPDLIQEELIKQVSNSSMRVFSCSWEEFVSNLKESLDYYSPSIIICYRELNSSFIPLSIMASGIALISVASEPLKFETLDGYNSFTFNKNEPSNSLKWATQLVSNPQYLQEVTANGKQTAAQIEQKFKARFLHCLNDSKRFIP